MGQFGIRPLNRPYLAKYQPIEKLLHLFWSKYGISEVLVSDLDFSNCVDI
jgi:hypothetical protein